MQRLLILSGFLCVILAGGLGLSASEQPKKQPVPDKKARDIAVLAGQPVLTLSAIDKLAVGYEVPGLELKAEALGKLVNHVPVKESSKTLAELALTLIAEALDSDNYDAATAFGKVAGEA